LDFCRFPSCANHGEFSKQLRFKGSLDGNLRDYILAAKCQLPQSSAKAKKPEKKQKSQKRKAEDEMV
jgi:hypothetical protein